MVAMRLSASLARSCAPFVVASALLLNGCGGAVSPDKARSLAVAEAAGGALSGATLERWMLQSPVLPTKAVGSGLVSAWMNAALIIDAVRRNAILDDPATTDSVIFSDAERGMLAQFFIARAKALPPVTEKQVDSLLARDRARVFQEIVMRSHAISDTLANQKLGRTAVALFTKLQAGGDFTAAVKQYSEDSVTRARNGFLPARTESEMPQRFASVWRLLPGAVAQPFGVGNGVFIIRRATHDESRPLLKEWLLPQLAKHADSLFVDSLARAHNIVIAADARLRVRAMALEPINLSEGGPLVTWQGGSLSAASVRDATMMLTPEQRIEISDASDTVATEFLMGLARRDIVMPLVGKDPPPDAPARAALAPAYRRMLDSLRSAVKRLPAGLSAADAATQWMDSILTRRAQYMPLPGALASVLRGRTPVKVSQPVFVGVVRGVLPRWQEAHRNDSTTKGGLVPAAGGPPKP
jgi:hypothetical protein